MGFLFGPDTSTANRATIGGMMGNNSAGSHSILYGKTIDHVLEMDVILASCEGRTLREMKFDDALARAITGGATQVVILGAGFDSHAYRCQELLAGARVFEVDRPATQALKKQREALEARAS